jgi:hypothetical protein
MDYNVLVIMANLEKYLACPPVGRLGSAIQLRKRPTTEASKRATTIEKGKRKVTEAFLQAPVKANT